MQDFPVQGNPVQVNAVVVKQKSPESGKFGAVFGGTVHRADRLRTPPYRGVSRGDRGDVRGLCEVVLAYNFLLENKTYILVRWAFPAWEFCDTGICFSQ